MRISWLSPTQLNAARKQFAGTDHAANERTLGTSVDWERWFARVDFSGAAPVLQDFVVPARPAEIEATVWPLIAEHVARAERITAVLQTDGLEAARARFAESGVAIEAATLAAAAHFAEELTLDDVLRVLRCPIDPFVFYANILELLVALQPMVKGEPTGASLLDYEAFIANYEARLSEFAFGKERIAVAVDGLADLYVARGVYDRGEALFWRRHQEDRGDVAVALSASRAFLAAGKLAAAVLWLERAADRARELGRADMAAKLDVKRDVIHRRMS